MSVNAGFISHGRAVIKPALCVMVIVFSVLRENCLLKKLKSFYPLLQAVLSMSLGCSDASRCHVVVLVCSLQQCRTFLYANCHMYFLGGGTESLQVFCLLSK